MSHVDSLDEEIKRILAEVDADDSKESDNSKKKVHEKKPYQISDKNVEWETNTLEDADADW